MMGEAIAQRLARQHRFVDGAAAFDHDAVHRHLLARTHARQIADVQMRQRYIRLAAIGFDAACGLRRQAEQRPNRRRSLRARLQLEDLPEQRQRNDDRGRLELDRDPAHRDKVSRRLAAARAWQRRCR